MKIVQRAVWYIESHIVEPINLDSIAAASAVSRFHLSRNFTYVVGCTVSEYIRSRRLSEAAKLLAEGDQDILDVALAIGYCSHEAFTRAFQTEFGLLPIAVRKACTTVNLNLMEPYSIESNTTINLKDPVYREEGPLFLVGIREFRTYEQRVGIPDQWRRFNELADLIPDQAGQRGFGVCFSTTSTEEGFDYLASVSVPSLDWLPEGLVGVRIPKQRYAVFHHSDHVSTIGDTCAAIFGKWQEKSEALFGEGHTSVIECYGKSFDPNTGRGGLEIWIPLES